MRDRSTMRIAPMFGAGEVLSSPSLPLLLALLLLFGGLTPLQGQDELPKTIASDLSLPFDRTDLLEQGEFRRAWSLLPSDIRQWGSYDHLKRGESALYAGLVSQAVRTLREVIDDGANRSIQQRAALQIGRIELAAGAYPEARLTLNRLFSEDGREGGGANELPSDVAGEALFWIGVSHLLESRSAAVVQGQQMFDASAADHPWNPRADDALYYSGQLFEAEGRNDEALARYRRLSDRYPESPYRIAATLRQVQVLHQTRRFDEALVRLEEAEVLWDRSEEAGTTKSEHFSSLIPLELVLLRGEISIGRGDLAGSERAWLTLLHELDGGYRRVGRLALAETYRIAGAVDSAVALYNRIIAGGTEDGPGRAARFFSPLAHATGRGVPPSDRAAGIAQLEEFADDASDPMWDAASLALAGIRYGSGEDAAALMSVESLLASSESPTLRLRAATIGSAALLRLGRPDAAVAMIATAREEGRGIPLIEMPERPAVIMSGVRLEATAHLAAGRPIDALPLLGNYLRSATDTSRFPAILRQKGQAELRSGQPGAAIATLEGLVDDFGGSPIVEQTLYELGWLHMRDGEIRRAEHAFTRLLKAYPTGPYAGEAMLRRADCFYLNKQFAEAAALYSRVGQEADPDSRSGQRADPSGTVDPAVGNSVVAEAASIPAPKATEEERRYALYQGGMAAWQAGETEEAERRFARYAAIYPGSDYFDDALFMRGLIAYRSGAYPSAIDRMEILLDQCEDSPLQARAYYTIADAHYRQGAFDEALGAYSIVIGRYPESSYSPDAETGIVYARAAREKRLDRTRVADVLRVADMGTEERVAGRTDDELELRRGEIFLEANRIDAAEGEYLSFIAKNPDSPNLPDAWLGLAEVALARRDTTTALDTLAALVDRFDRGSLVPVAILRLAELREQTGDTLGAVAALDRVATDFPESAPVPLSLLEKSRLLEAVGDTAGAIDALLWGAVRLDTVIGVHTRTGGRIISELVRMQLNSDEIAGAAFGWELLSLREDSLGVASAVRLGDYLQMQGLFDRATTLYDHAITHGETVPDLLAVAQLGRGRLYEFSGETQRAVDLYSAVVAAFGDEGPGAEAGRRLADLGIPSATTTPSVPEESSPRDEATTLPDDPARAIGQSPSIETKQVVYRSVPQQKPIESSEQNGSTDEVEL